MGSPNICIVKVFHKEAHTRRHEYCHTRDFFKKNKDRELNEILAAWSSIPKESPDKRAQYLKSLSTNLKLTTTRESKKHKYFLFGQHVCVESLACAFKVDHKTLTTYLFDDFLRKPGKGNYEHSLRSQRRIDDVSKFANQQECERSHYSPCCKKLFWTKFRY
jgi:hypothetical protein